MLMRIATDHEDIVDAVSSCEANNELSSTGRYIIVVRYSALVETCEMERAMERKQCVAFLRAECEHYDKLYRQSNGLSALWNKRQTALDSLIRFMVQHPE